MSNVRNMINYTEFKDSIARNQDDTELASEALKRVNAEDASAGEKLPALGIAGIMTGKHKLGMGLRKIKHNNMSG